MKFLMFLFKVTLSIAIFFSCSKSKNTALKSDRQILPIVTLEKQSLLSDSAYYLSRLSNISKLPLAQIHLTSFDCCRIMLLQMNGCQLCTEYTFSYINSEAKKAKERILIAVVGNNKDLSIVKQQIKSTKIQFELIEQVKANKFGLELIENFDIHFCNQELVDYKIID